MKHGSVLRQNLSLLFAIILTTGILFAWTGTARLQSKTDETPRQSDERAVTSHVRFDDAREINAGADASGSQPVAIVSADLDSDGFADVVTADTSGRLHLLKGRDPAIFAFKPEQKEQAKPDPFAVAALDASLGISPDEIFAGDFNADGKPDIIGVAKGSTAVALVFGDGTGHFSAAVNIGVAGKITAAASGEIGKPDGQADLAIAFTNKSGSFLAVYEHPESAFKHAPEIIRLPSAGTSLAVGNVDEDFYSDIAVACGYDLVIVHERGQVYPWDIVKGSGIVRPPAVVETSRLPFSIASMAVGRFGEKRGTSLALLGGDGNIYHLQAPQNAVSNAPKLDARIAPGLAAAPFQPAESKGRPMAVIQQEPREQGEIDSYGDPVGDAVSRKEPGNVPADTKPGAPAPKIDLSEVSRRNAEDAPRKAAMQQRTKDAFIRTISAKASNLAKWEIGQITSDHRYASIGSDGAKLTRAAVSDSPFDDLIVTSTRTGDAEIVSRYREDTGRSATITEVIEGSGGIVGILPMRINLDGLSDIVLLRQGAPTPSVLMTAPSAVFVVNTTADDADCNFGGSCSLRDAIRRANVVGGSSTIYFDFPTSPSVISPLTPLPAIVRPITIQGNNLLNGSKTVEISGENAGIGVDGLKIRASNAFIYDLAITGFKSQTISGSQIGGNGIAIESDSAFPNNAGNTILACYLGVDVTGATAKKNMAAGVLIFDSDSNDLTNNTTSGNDTGVAVEGGNSNSFSNNTIGLNAAGTDKVPNRNGIFLGGANNRVGGDFAGSPNTISGNGVVSNFAPCIGYGIVVPIFVDMTTQELLSHDNNVQGNKLGTDPTGGVGLGNCWQGINVEPLTGTTIGSITESGRNIISGNGLGGVWCEAVGNANLTEGGFCSIMGNNVGTDITGSYSIYNDVHNTPPISGTQTAVLAGTNYSVSAIGAPGGTTPGGPCTGFCNLVSGNAGGFDVGGAVMIGGPGSAGVFNNYIGTKRNGVDALGNAGAGILMASTTVPGAAPTYYAGGYTTFDGSLGNLVAANSFVGIQAGNQFPGDYHILGNLIGTDVSGTNALPNGYGIEINTTFTNTVEIGDSDPLGRNIISGNTFDGILVISGYGVAIVNNLIGVNSALAPLGNARNGINLGSFFPIYLAKVGGTGPAMPNIIANNGKSGVKLTNDGSILNEIRGNAIYNNGQLGIDLSLAGLFPDGDGVTVNDYCSLDADGGPNTLQNYPELFPLTQNMDGTIRVEGILRSVPHGTFDIDIYSNSTADPSSHGEGETYLGTIAVTTDGNGFGSFAFDSATAMSTSALIAATATDSVGNTSEFSCIAGSSCSSLAGAATLAEYLAVPQEACPASIKVNLDGDQPDVNLADGFCDIDTANGDNHECTLRAALQIVMQPNYVGTHTIQFEIPGPGVHMITTTGLPAITNYVTIDGESQPGYVDKPLIEIRGTGASAGTGLELQTTGSTIKGLALNNFFDHAIHINGGSANRVQSCFIGVAADGTTPGPDLPNSAGIFIQNSHDNTIGGNAGARNVIGRMFYGVYISGGRQNFLFNNYIGVDASGSAARGNAVGVLVLGSDDNWIGKKFDVDGNVVSGNSLGIQITSNSNHTTIQGNKIGTESTGMAAIGNNSYGILVETGSANTQIGSGLGYVARNVIGGHTGNNRSAGILLNADAGVNNSVNGNYIGVNKDASAKIPNTFGVVAFADEQTIGGGNGFPNIISGNTDSGILVTTPTGSPNASVDGTKLIGNNVGTNSQGTATDLGNGKIGIAILGNVKTATVRQNLVGNNPVGIYAGSTTDSIGPSGNKFEKNNIGLSPFGSAQTALPNGAGIILKGASGNTLSENTVSANSVFGVILGSVIDDAINQPPPGAELETSLNKLLDNRIGTDFPGFTAFPNGKVGLVVGDFANNNCIGSCSGVGVTGGFGNVISGHGSASGIGILLGSLSTTAPPANWPSGNQFRDNTVGMNRDLSDCLPNRIGMLITKAGGNQIGVRVGGFKHGNVFTCNNYQGISVEGQTNGETIIESNWVGVTPTGQNFPNNTAGGIGIFYTTDTKKVWIKDTTIGGQKYGVYAVQTGGNRPAAINDGLPLPDPIVQVTNSLIGVFRDVNGSLVPVGNEVGIFAENASRVLIGKLSADGTSKNIISANSEDAIRLRGGGENRINDTIAGTDESGSAGLGNGGNAVAIIDSIGNVLGTDDQQLASAVQNIFSGNSGKGVLVSGSGSDGNKIFGCKIGLALRQSANVRLPNEIGIALDGATNTLIGSGISTGLKNFISGNNGPGVKLINSFSNYLKGNYIGTDEFGTQGLGNTGDGVIISESSTLNQVGDPSPDSGNTIAFNTGAGVNIDPTAGAGNLVDPNKIYSNGGLGIDIGQPGHDANDPDDADEGPNRMQNYPVITDYHIDGNGHLIVSYSLDSLPGNSNYGVDGIRVEFFKADASGEGNEFLDADQYTVADHDAFARARRPGGRRPSVGGSKTVDLGNPAGVGFGPGDVVTASATDADGNTSEFFPPFAPSAASVRISGSVTDLVGRPVNGAAVSVTANDGSVKTALTNPFGFFEIEDLEVGRTYIVTVRHRLFTFSPRLISLDGQITELNLKPDN